MFTNNLAVLVDINKPLQVPSVYKLTSIM